MRNLNLNLFGLATGAMFVTALTCQNMQANPSISIASVPHGFVDFSGASQFSFVNATSGVNAGYSFDVNGASASLPGDSIGDVGNMSGTYTIGTITTTGPIQSAPVTGSGTLTIFDGSVDLTGTLVWNNIATMGTGSTLNVSGELNLTSVTYSGVQVDLKTFAAAGALSDTVDFTFNPAETLTQLATTSSPLKTSFSGTITTVPDSAMTIELLGGAFLAIAGLRRKMAC